MCYSRSDVLVRDSVPSPHVCKGCPSRVTGLAHRLVWAAAEPAPDRLAEKAGVVLRRFWAMVVLGPFVEEVEHLGSKTFAGPLDMRK